VKTDSGSKIESPIKGRGDEGFTLIELLIVIVVLGILAAVVVLALGSVTGDARKSACNSDAKTIITAVQAYNAAAAPTDITVEKTSGPGSITQGSPLTYDAAGTQASLLLGYSPPYLNAWPTGGDGTYALSLSTTRAGDVMIYVPSTSTTGINYDTETSTTGCNKL
jgi:prepilin-type N-terminal cleavage/methylation domain-containing protein